MGGVGVGMQPAEIGQRVGMERGAVGRAEPALEDLAGIRPGDRVHRVERQAEPATQQIAQPVEIEDPLHQRRVVGDGVDNRHLHLAQPGRAEAPERHIGALERAIGGDRLGVAIDRLGHPLGGRAAVFGIVLDAEIAVRAAGIMAC